MIHIGFTGTRNGMTSSQYEAVKWILDALVTIGGLATAHHGDCIGADQHFHHLCQLNRIRIVGHVPEDTSLQARCDCDETMPPLPYLERNRKIVEVAGYMIATPAEETEQQRGGTWSTIRAARRAGKPLAVVPPTGRVEWERWPHLGERLP